MSEVTKQLLPSGTFYVFHEDASSKNKVYRLIPAEKDSEGIDQYTVQYDENFRSSARYDADTVIDVIQRGDWVISDSEGKPIVTEVFVDANGNPAPAKIHTGGSSDYYKVYVEDPTSGGEPYMAECNDIIEALNLTFAQANIFKAIWRTAAAENLGLEKEGNNAVYDAEKMVFFSGRNLRHQKRLQARG